MLGKRKPQLTTAVYHEFPDLAIEVFAWTVVERRDVKRRKGRGKAREVVCWLVQVEIDRQYAFYSGGDN